jgi:hypothetical protein
MRPAAKCAGCGARIYPDRITHKGGHDVLRHHTEPMGRFELPANRLQGGCSTPELHRLGPDSPMGHPEVEQPDSDLLKLRHLR